MKRMLNSCNLKFKGLRLSIEDRKNTQSPNIHNMSNSAVITLDKSLKSKVSFDIDEIRQEIRDRENRHTEREKEFHEIYKSVSNCDEKIVFSEEFVETSENHQEEAETRTEGPDIYFKCCKRFCNLL